VILHDFPHDLRLIHGRFISEKYEVVDSMIRDRWTDIKSSKLMMHLYKYELKHLDSFQ